MASIPKVFISHATEDKERFVREFATKLRARGIDAWVDEWEIFPGNSLVQKIFNEGLKQASAVVVVLSRCSVNKPWVREEIDAAFIKRVNQGSKLIPVIIDDCEIPAVLHSTAWQRIPDVSSYEKELDRIVTSILGGTNKPPLGPLPKYLQTIINTFPGLTKIDSIVLDRACEILLQKNNPMHLLVSAEICESIKGDGVPADAFGESIEILDSRGFISGTKVIGGAIPFFTISRHTFDDYLKSRIKNFESLVRQIGLEITNSGLKKSEELAAKLGQPHIVVAHLIDSMESSGLIRSAKIAGGSRLITDVSAELKRRLYQD
jgi:hypothetical protein